MRLLVITHVVLNSRNTLRSSSAVVVLLIRCASLVLHALSVFSGWNALWSTNTEAVQIRRNASLDLRNLWFVTELIFRLRYTVWSTSAISISLGRNTGLVSSTCMISLSRHTIWSSDTVAVCIRRHALLHSRSIAEVVAFSRDALVGSSAVIVVESRDARRLAEVVAGHWSAFRSAETEPVDRGWHALSDAHVVHLVVVAFRGTDAVSIFFRWDAFLSVGLVALIIVWSRNALRCASAVVVQDRWDTEFTAVSVGRSRNTFWSTHAVVILTSWDTSLLLRFSASWVKSWIASWSSYEWSTINIAFSIFIVASDAQRRARSKDTNLALEVSALSANVLSPNSNSTSSNSYSDELQLWGQRSPIDFGADLAVAVATGVVHLLWSGECGPRRTAGSESVWLIWLSWSE